MHELRRKSWDNMGVAAIAAYMLFLQGLLGAFAIGAADAAQLDVFGNPLCITSGEHAAVDLDGSHTSSSMECCTAACGMGVGGASPSRAPHALDNPLSVTVDASAAPQAALPRIASTQRGPGSPRSPPLAG